MLGHGRGNSHDNSATVDRDGPGRYLVDTPGMRELGILDAADGISESFSNIADLATHCRFSDCTHTHEPGCAVRGSVDEGELASYQELVRENERNAQTYHERRQADRQFGKHCKAVMNATATTVQSTRLDLLNEVSMEQSESPRKQPTPPVSEILMTQRFRFLIPAGLVAALTLGTPGFLGARDQAVSRCVLFHVPGPAE
jgi:hypothetical protein